MDSEKFTSEEIEAIADYHIKESQFRNLQRVSWGFTPKAEYVTKTRGDYLLPDGSTRKPKYLRRHPTKKTSHSTKGEKIETQLALLQLDLFNAQQKANAIMRKKGYIPRG